MTSSNPNDVKFGYCGNCHAYTGVDHTQEQAVIGLACPECHLTSPFHAETCSLLLEHRRDIQAEFGDRHPSLKPVRGELQSMDQILVRPRETTLQPAPGDADWAEWAQLVDDIRDAPCMAELMDLEQRREVALHLWRLGYRRSG